MSSACTSSLNRNDEWKRCCAGAMGFEWVDCFNDGNDNDVNESERVNESESESEDILQVTNLLYDDDDDDDDDFEDNDIYKVERGDRQYKYDVWIENALRIQADLNRMSQWVQSKKQEYIGLDMKDEEAALIQSTVTSFAATTASELETLRNMINSRSRSNNNTIVINSNLSNHRAGIVQILLVQLQEQVTKPFVILQKQRFRVAVQLWQNPLQCKLYEPKLKPKRQSQRQPQDLLFDDDDEDGDRWEQPKEQRFLPERSYQESTSKNNNNNNVSDFILKYANKHSIIIPTTPPDFLARILKRRSAMETEDEHRSTPPSPLSQQPNQKQEQIFENIPSSSFSGLDNSLAGAKLPQRFQSRSQGRQAVSIDNNPEYYQQQLEEDLRSESVQLTTTLIVSNDLNSVQQMETRMVEITTLIGQFSNLVQDQQEQVLEVHENAKETKDNLDKGQENLVDAAERTKKSRNYKAWLILAMAAILMFFQILRN